MVAMKVFLTALLSFGYIAIGFSQQAIMGNFRSVGMGGGYMFNIDDAALNSNPSLLGWQSHHFDHKFAITFKDIYAVSYSPVVSYAIDQFGLSEFNADEDDGGEGFVDLGALEVGFEMLESYDHSTQTYNTYDTNVSQQNRALYKTALMRNNSTRINNTILGLSYTSENHGTFAFRIQEATSIKMKLSDKLAELTAFGKTASYFDSLVLINGSHIGNDISNYQDSILSQVHTSFSNDTLTIGEIMNGSNLEFLQTRTYSLGWGDQYQLNNEDVALFLGANLNVIEGLNLITLSGTDNEIVIANFSKGKLRKSPTINTGLGASVSFSGTIAYQKKWLLSVGMNHLGYIHWKKRKRKAGHGVYSAQGDNEQFASYAYGVSPATYFNDQLEEANFNWDEVNVNTGKASIIEATPANIHLGIRKQFGSWFSIGGNIVSPIIKSAPGSMDRAVLSANYEFTFKKFTYFGGLNNMNRTTSLPLGFSIGSRKSKWEVGLSIPDLLGYLKKSRTNNYGVGVGVTYRIK
jgi:hypothetical protein